MAQEPTPLQATAQGMLSSETMDEAVLLGRINHEAMTGFMWCGESRAVGVNRQGIWLYDTGENGQIDLIPAAQPIEGETNTTLTLQTASPDCRWLIGIETAQVAQEGQAAATIGRFKLWDALTKQDVPVPAELANLYQYERHKTIEYHFVWAGPTLFVYRTALSLIGRRYDERDSQLQIWKTEGTQFALEKIIEYPALERTPYTFEYVLPSNDGRQFITAVRSFISEQHIVTRWDRATTTPTVLYEEPPIPQTPTVITGLQWADDETSVGIVTGDNVLRYAIPSGEALPAYTGVCGDLIFVGVLYAQETVICTSQILSYGPGPLTLVRLKPNTAQPEEQIGLEWSWQWKPSPAMTGSPWTMFLFVNRSDDIVFLNVETMDERPFKTRDRIFDFMVKGDETQVLMGSQDSWRGAGDVRLWNLETQETPEVIFAAQVFNDVVIVPDSSSILTITAQGIMQWTSLDQRPEPLAIEVANPNALAFSPDHQTLYVTNRQAIYVFDWPALSLREEIKSRVSIHNLLPIPDGEALVVTSDRGQLLLLDTDGTILTQRTIRNPFYSFPFPYFAITSDNQYLVLDNTAYQVTDRALLPVELVRPEQPPLVQQILAIRDKYKSLSWNDQNKITGFVYPLPRLVQTTQGTDLIPLDNVMAQLAAEALPQALPLQVLASDRLLVIDTQEALWIYGIPEGTEP